MSDRIEIKSLSQLVQHAYKEASGGVTSPELMNYKSLGMNETVNSEGAYAVTAQLASQIMTATQQSSVCYSKAKILNVSKGKSVKLPYLKEAYDSNVASDILTAYWPGEGVAKTISHPCYGQLDLPLHTLAVLTPITDELFEDVQQLESYLKNLVPVKMGKAIDKAMIYGVPGSTMWGITSAGAIGVIGVANNDPITLANMIAYEKALAAQNKAAAQWYMGTEQYNELLDLIDDTKTNTSYKWEKDGLYVLGHKVNVCNFLVKNQYDLILGDFGEYVVAQRALEAVTSISFKFNFDEKVIRWTMRLNGASFGNKMSLKMVHW
jgi:HK97 family phage major capsid protein